MGLSPLIQGNPIPESTLPIPSKRIEMLFYEYLRRYKELKNAQIREFIWLFILITTGLGGFIILWLGLERTGIGWKTLLLSILSFVLFALALHGYIQTNHQVEYIRVNVTILHHHFLGVLEVGFCGHTFPCHCAEAFRRFVWEKHHVSLYAHRPYP